MEINKIATLKYYDNSPIYSTINKKQYLHDMYVLIYYYS